MGDWEAIRCAKLIFGDYHPPKYRAAQRPGFKQIRIAGLGQMLMRGSYGLKNHLLIQLPGEDNPNDIRVALHDLGQQLHAIHSRHLHVGDNRVNGFLVDNVQCRLTAGDKVHIPFMAHTAEHSLETLKHQWFIINKKDLSNLCGFHIRPSDS
jgi:hypothetical protein